MTNFIGVAIWVFALLGWVLNIVQLAQYDHFTGMAIVRSMGIMIAPLGAILGYF